MKNKRKQFGWYIQHSEEVFGGYTSRAKARDDAVEKGPLSYPIYTCEILKAPPNAEGVNCVITNPKKVTRMNRRAER